MDVLKSAYHLRVALAFFIFAAVSVLTPVTGSTADDFDPATGYRIARYRSPVHNSVPGGTRIAAPEVIDLVAKGAVLIDVMPAEGAGLDAASGSWRITKGHDTLPGAVWLPDVGKGIAEPVIETFFKDELDRLTSGDKSKSLIIFCQADCWMSWNAVKRAAVYGYNAVYWFAEGTDGWRDWDGKFVPAVPTPVRNSQPID